MDQVRSRLSPIQRPRPDEGQRRMELDLPLPQSEAFIFDESSTYMSNIGYGSYILLQSTEMSTTIRPVRCHYRAIPSSNGNARHVVFSAAKTPRSSPL